MDVTIVDRLIIICVIVRGTGHRHVICVVVHSVGVTVSGLDDRILPETVVVMTMDE